MAESGCKLVAPKKKKRVRAPRHAPFPVPIRSITHETANAGKWFYYSGQLCGTAVLVSHSGDIHHLYNMGFFGKGNLSRSGLEFSKSFQSVVPRHPDDKVLQVMKRQRFIRHLNWQRQTEAHQSGKTDFTDINEYDSDQEPDEEKIVQKRDVVENIDNGQMADEAESCEVEDISANRNCHQQEEEEREFWDISLGNSETGHVRKCRQSAEALWDAQEADEDFWGCSETSGKKTHPKGGVQVEKAQTDEAYKTHLVQGAKSCDESVYPLENSKDLTKKNCVKQVVTDKSSNNKDDCVHLIEDDGKCHRPKDQSQICHEPEVESDLVSSGWRKVMCSENLVASDEINLTEKDNRTLYLQNCEGFVEANFSDEKICDKTKDPCQTQSSPLQTCEHSPDVENHPSSSKTVKDVQPCDPLCESHEMDGDVLVVSDSDDEGYGVGTSFRPHWERVIKNDPYKLHEHLQLSLEEAFFLSYGLGCLVCQDHSQRSMNLTEMWQTFSKLKKSFIPSYIAYHHFRSKGWVPKPGIKFGVNYILYKEGPPFYHASYSVVVRMVDETTLRDNEDYISRTLSWPALSGLNRITENVAKELMFCFVICPSNLNQEAVNSPACIPQFKVQEMIVKRWVPAQERETKELEDIL